MPHRSTERTFDTHARLRDLIDDLEAADTRNRASLVLRSLRSYLPQHFADEEKPDGVIAWLSVQLPDQAERINQIRLEHTALRTVLQGLVARSYDDEIEVALFLSDCRAFCTSLRDHESHESELMGLTLGMS